MIIDSRSYAEVANAIARSLDWSGCHTYDIFWRPEQGTIYITIYSDLKSTLPCAKFDLLKELNAMLIDFDKVTGKLTYAVTYKRAKEVFHLKEDK